MNREQQRQLKLLKTALPAIIKETASRYKLKKKADMLYCVKNELFFDCLITVGASESDEFLVRVRESLKPMWLDELLWELLGMEENKKAPVSLRAVGAFAVSGVFVYKDEIKLDPVSEEGLKKAVTGCIEHFCDTVKNSTMQHFIDNISQPYHRDVREALYYIHNEQYSDALMAVGAGRGIFRNGKTDINDAVRKYCTEHMG